MNEMKEYIRLIGGIRKTITYLTVFLFGLMLLGSPVLAQEGSDQSQEEFELEDVVVTGSVLRTKGMETPNPVTVVTVEEMEVLAPINLIESLSQLPQFYQSTTTQNQTGFFQSAQYRHWHLGGVFQQLSDPHPGRERRTMDAIASACGVELALDARRRGLAGNRVLFRPPPRPGKPALACDARPGW